MSPMCEARRGAQGTQLILRTMAALTKTRESYLAVPGPCAVSEHSVSSNASRRSHEALGIRDRVFLVCALVSELQSSSIYLKWCRKRGGKQPVSVTIIAGPSAFHSRRARLHVSVHSEGPKHGRLALDVRDSHAVLKVTVDSKSLHDRRCVFQDYQPEGSLLLPH
ncbi:hypothetical protein FKP32DRAFT_1683598 [Trametes sanguinea]|nr:hypothetical protein FKP32DRAFT_1683598 [Trametes sanguinea]